MEPERAKFYNSRRWRKVSRLYMASRHYICERCGGLGVICHHRRPITGADIGDLDKTIGQANLECLCLACHNEAHGGRYRRVIFDDAGRVVGVEDGRRDAHMTGTEGDVDEPDQADR